MDVGAVSSAIQAEYIQNLYAAKCMLMARESGAVVGDLLQDTVEISKEAMERYLSELQR